MNVSYNLSFVKAYLAAYQRGLETYAAQKTVAQGAAHGKFSSARTFRQYTQEIWKAKPCPSEDESLNSRT